MGRGTITGEGGAGSRLGEPGSNQLNPIANQRSTTTKFPVSSINVGLIRVNSLKYDSASPREGTIDLELLSCKWNNRLVVGTSVERAK